MNSTENLIQVSEKNSHFLTVENVMIVVDCLSLRVEIPKLASRLWEDKYSLSLITIFECCIFQLEGLFHQPYLQLVINYALRNSCLKGSIVTDDFII